MLNPIFSPAFCVLYGLINGEDNLPAGRPMSAHYGQTAEGAGSLRPMGTCRERPLLGHLRLEEVLWLGPASLAIGSPPSTHLVYQEGAVCFLLTSAGAVMLELITVHSLFAVSPLPVEASKRSSFSWGSRSLLRSSHVRPAPLSRWALTQASPGGWEPGSSHFNI